MLRLWSLTGRSGRNKLDMVAEAEASVWLDGRRFGSAIDILGDVHVHIEGE
jgi:hypothetical protein